jgi:hypothetical protein
LSDQQRRCGYFVRADCQNNLPQDFLLGQVALIFARNQSYVGHCREHLDLDSLALGRYAQAGVGQNALTNPPNQSIHGPLCGLRLEPKL